MTDPGSSPPRSGTLAGRAAVHRALGEPHRLAIAEELALTDRTPSQLSARLQIPANLLAHHLDVLESSGIVRRLVSEGDRRRRYVTLLDGVAGYLAAGPSTPWHGGIDTAGRVDTPAADVLFLCTANSARSPYAAAVWRRRTGGMARSAGAAPAPVVDPTAVAVGARRGVDLADHRPTGVDVGAEPPTLQVTVCDRAQEDGVPFATPVLHWSVPDPVGSSSDSFEAAFDAIEARVEVLARHVRVTA